MLITLYGFTSECDENLETDVYTTLKNLNKIRNELNFVKSHGQSCWVRKPTSDVRKWAARGFA